MNRLSIRVLGCPTSMILGLVMLAGCGPQDLNDPDYLMQMKNANEDVAAQANQDQDQDQARMAPQQQAAPPQANQAMAASAPANVVAGAPAVAVAPVAVVVPEIVNGPNALVVAPDLIQTLPPVVINTAEEQRFVRSVDHVRNIRIFQPMITDHVVVNTQRIHHRYWTNVVNIPTHATRVCPTYNVIQTAEVMPTTEITLPVSESIIPCVGACGGGFGFGGGLGYGLGYGFGRAGFLGGY
jgi:hypothetical protein